MDPTIMAVVISGLVSICTTLISSARNNALQDERIKVIQNDMKNLSDRVEKHNNYGLQLAKLETRVEILERKN